MAFLDLQSQKPTYKEMLHGTSLPLIRRKLKGPRQAINYFTFGGSIAKWPDDNMLETRAPFLQIVVEGTADCCNGDYIIQVPKGQAILVPGGIPRRTGESSLLDISDNPRRYSKDIFFCEHCGNLKIWIATSRGNTHYKATPGETMMIPQSHFLLLLKDLGKEAKEADKYHQEILHDLFRVFLWRVQRALLGGKIITTGKLLSSQTSSEEKYDPIEEAQQYIRENLSKHLTQESVACEVYLSRTQFIRRFHESTGQTFNQFVASCRLEQAKVLLEQSNFTLEYIRQAIGFKSSTYFNTFFQKNEGMLPSEYRKKDRLS